MSLLVLFALISRAKRALKPLWWLRLLNTLSIAPQIIEPPTAHWTPPQPKYTRMHTALAHTHAHTLELPNGCMMSVWALPAAAATAVSVSASAPKLQFSINASTPQLCPIELLHTCDSLADSAALPHCHIATLPRSCIATLPVCSSAALPLWHFATVTPT